MTSTASWTRLESFETNGRLVELLSTYRARRVRRAADDFALCGRVSIGLQARLWCARQHVMLMTPFVAIGSFGVGLATVFEIAGPDEWPRAAGIGVALAVLNSFALVALGARERERHVCGPTLVSTRDPGVVPAGEWVEVWRRRPPAGHRGLRAVVRVEAVHQRAGDVEISASDGDRYRDVPAVVVLNPDDEAHLVHVPAHAWPFDDADGEDRGSPSGPVAVAWLASAADTAGEGDWRWWALCRVLAPLAVLVGSVVLADSLLAAGASVLAPGWLLLLATGPLCRAWSDLRPIDWSAP